MSHLVSRQESLRCLHLSIREPYTSWLAFWWPRRSHNKLVKKIDTGNMLHHTRRSLPSCRERWRKLSVPKHWMDYGTTSIIFKIGLGFSRPLKVVESQWKCITLNYYRVLMTWGCLYHAGRTTVYWLWTQKHRSHGRSTPQSESCAAGGCHQTASHSLAPCPARWR